MENINSKKEKNRVSNRKMLYFIYNEKVFYLNMFKIYADIIEQKWSVV